MAASLSFEERVNPEFGRGRLLGNNPLKIPYSLPISQWKEFEDHIVKQLPALNSDTNVPGLECARSYNYNYEAGEYRDKIEYHKSKFGMFDDMIKLHHTEAADNIHLAKKVGSMIQVFSSPDAHYYPYYLVQSYGYIMNLLTDMKSGKGEQNINMNALFEDKYDERILLNAIEVDDFVKFARRPHNPFTAQYEEIFRLADDGKPVCMITYCSKQTYGGGQFHATAAILRKQSGIFTLALYDPMYFIRPDKRYTWALETSFVTWKLIAKLLGHSLTIQNLSSMCLKEEKGEIKCVQYKIDAEYCLPYSLYFVYLYSKAGFPKDAKTLRRVIQETYLSDPRELVRNPCKVTNEFRVRMISFTLTCFLLFSAGLDPYKRISDTYIILMGKTRISLFHPFVMNILKEALDFFARKGLRTAYIEFPKKEEYDEMIRREEEMRVAEYKRQEELRKKLENAALAKKKEQRRLAEAARQIAANQVAATTTITREAPVAPRPGLSCKGGVCSIMGGGVTRRGHRRRATKKRGRK